jgi:F0F1-type ATP synthase assembly protein I
MDQNIEILFKEYDTLRNEIVTRTNNGYQLVAISGALAAGLIGWFSQHYFDRTFWLLLSVFAFVILVAAVLLIVDLRRLSLRLQELESEINKLAGTDLLKWERLHGGGWLGDLIFRRKSK